MVCVPLAFQTPKLRQRYSGEGTKLSLDEWLVARSCRCCCLDTAACSTGTCSLLIRTGENLTPIAPCHHSACRIHLLKGVSEKWRELQALDSREPLIQIFARPIYPLITSKLNHCSPWWNMKGDVDAEVPTLL